MQRLGFLFLLIASLVTARGISAQSTPAAVTVNGFGEVHLTPDEAVITLGVETRHLEAREAKARNNTVSRRILKLAQALEIPAKDVQSRILALQAEYEYSAKKERTFRGYHVYHQIVVTIRDLSKVEKFLDEAVQEGANRVESIIFSSSRKMEAEREALEKAVKDAKAKAERMLQAAGQNLGRLLELEESGGVSFPRPLAAARVESYDPGAPALAPGEFSVQKTVRAVWEIK